jgi:flagellar biosynthesis/type III secretory pathway chaperone
MLLRDKNKSQKQNDLTTKRNEKENRFMEQLSVVLKAQIALYKELLALSKSQVQELMIGNAIKVQEITTKSEELMKKLLLLDNERQNVIDDIMQKYKMHDNVNLVGLIQLFDIKSKNFLLNLVYDLEQITDELKLYIEQNKILLAKAMQFVDFNINVITSTTASDTYAPQGQECNAVRKKKMFDQSI